MKRKQKSRYILLREYRARRNARNRIARASRRRNRGK